MIIIIIVYHTWGHVWYKMKNDMALSRPIKISCRSAGQNSQDGGRGPSFEKKFPNIPVMFPLVVRNDHHYNFVPYSCTWEQNEIIWFERIQDSCQSMYLAAVAARFSWKHWSFTSFSPRITSFLIFSIKFTYCPQWTHFAEIENKKFLH